MLCSEWLLKKARLKDAEIRDEFWGSDHCPVQATFDLADFDIGEYYRQQVSDGDETLQDIDEEEELHQKYAQSPSDSSREVGDENGLNLD